MNRVCGIMVVAGALCADVAQAAFVWVEAEAADEVVSHRNSWWDSLRQGGLSGGALLASFSEIGQETGHGKVSFRVPEDGAYDLWWRASGTVAYQLDDGAKTRVDSKALQAADKQNARNRQWVKGFQDERNLALDGDTDARYYAWVRAARVTLTAGPHALVLSFGDDDLSTKRFGAVDAVVLTTEGFEPNGPYKPGEPNPNERMSDSSLMWDFAPEPDALSPDALLDLRSLNETVAGEHGFVRQSADGMSFVRGDGQPIRFWGGTDYSQRDLDLDRLKRHAAFLAKRGVNIAR